MGYPNEKVSLAVGNLNTKLLKWERLYLPFIAEVLEWKSDLVIPLFSTLLWLPNSVRVKLKSLKWFLWPYTMYPPVIFLSLSAPSLTTLISFMCCRKSIVLCSSLKALQPFPLPLPGALFLQIPFPLLHRLQVFALISPSQWCLF